MKKYNIETRINSVKGKHPNQVIRELRKVLAPEGKEMLGSKRLGEIRKAEIESSTDAKGGQLAIIAKYFNCKVNDLYTKEWLATLPTLKTIKKSETKASQAAA